MTTASLKFLHVFAESAPPPLNSVAGLSILILEGASSVKENKRGFNELSALIVELVLAVGSATSGGEGQLHDVLLPDLDEIHATLLKIQAFTSRHLSRNSLSLLLLRDEDARQLQVFETDVRRALNSFQAKSEALVQLSLDEQGIKIVDSMTKQLSVLEALSPHVKCAAIGMYDAAVLPPTPAVFYGREEEINAITQTFLSVRAAKIAILGPPGIGKTAIALASLHYPTTAVNFGARRYFVKCDTAMDSATLVELIAAAVGVVGPSQKEIQKKLVRSFGAVDTLLVLDNFESPWEPVDVRAAVEATLAVFAAIPSLTIVVTMRGAERPATVEWSKPFLAPIRPLDSDAAIHAFAAVADVTDTDPQFHALLDNLGGVPLAIMLMANTAQYQTCGALLKRWEAERTSLLDRGGQNRLSNLDVSISISLGSPRMLLVPQAAALLAIISMLPEGISDSDIPVIAPAVEFPRRCISTLLQTSLAYRVDASQIHVLAPVREYMIHHHPLSPSQLKAICDHFHSVSAEALKIWTPNGGLGRITGARNGQAVLRHALTVLPSTSTELRPTILWCTTALAYHTHDLLLLGLQRARQLNDEDLIAKCYTCFLKEEAFRGTTHIPEFSSTDELAAAAYALNCKSNNVKGQIVCLRMMKYDSASQRMAELERILSLARSSGPDETGTVLAEIAKEHASQGHLDLAASASDLAIATYKLAGPRTAGRLALHLFERGEWTSHAGKVDDALVYYAQARELGQEIQDVLWLANVDFSIGRAHAFRWNLALAVACFRASLQTYRADAFRGDRPALREVVILLSLADCLARLSRLDEAAQAAKEAQIQLSQLDKEWLWGTAGCALTLGSIANEQGDVALAHSYWQQALLNYRRISDPLARSNTAAVSIRIATAMIEQSRNEEAIIVLCDAMAILRKFSKGLNLVHALNSLADAYLATGDAATALALSRAVLPMLRHMDTKTQLATCILRFGKMSLLNGDTAAARARATEAAPIFAAGKYSRGVTECEQFLERLRSL